MEYNVTASAQGASSMATHNVNTGSPFPPPHGGGLTGDYHPCTAHMPCTPWVPVCPHSYSPVNRGNWPTPAVPPPAFPPSGVPLGDFGVCFKTGNISICNGCRSNFSGVDKMVIRHEEHRHAVHQSPYWPMYLCPSLEMRTIIQDVNVWS